MITLNNRIYIAIDMKSFYASVECVSRGLDPLRTNLLVADEERSDATICLAVSPSLKKIGVPSRPRLFEARRAIKLYEAAHKTKVEYIIAPPRMAEYEKVSADIYEVLLKYCSPEDIHVYSIDESFIDCTGYLHYYSGKAKKLGISEARCFAMTVIRDVLAKTGITATVGIGTNMYLAKIAMDIVAKKAPPDNDGVRIAELNEASYCYLLWDHYPLTDFWQIGRGKAARLNNAFLFTMGDIAAKSQTDEEWFYKTFGIDGEIIIDHAWGIEPVTMRDIKSYSVSSHSLSKGQVLPRPYKADEARIVLTEMIDDLCADMFGKGLISACFSWWVGYDPKTLSEPEKFGLPEYSGETASDYMGRAIPKHSAGTVRFESPTCSPSLVISRVIADFDSKAGRSLLFRRLGIAANGTIETQIKDNSKNINDCSAQLKLIREDEAADSFRLAKERELQAVMHEIRMKYGANSMLKGFNFEKSATARERNVLIGGHKA